MLLGLISDIHGNYEALDQVLAELRQADVELILCAGDLICYGAEDNRVLDRLQAEGIPCVMGNYDDAVAWDRPKASRKPSSPRNEPLKQAALDWSKANIEQRHIPYLRGLPWSSIHEIDGLRVRLLHAGPHYLDEWVTPDEPDLLSEIARRMPAVVTVLGHTHRPFVTQTDGTIFINPGAVGRSLDRDPRAAFATLDTRSLAVKHYRVAYNLDAAVHAIARSGMPPEIARLVEHGARRIENLDELRITSDE